MVHKTDTADSDAKGISLRRHKLRRLQERLSGRAAIIKVLTISITLWFVFFKVVQFFLVG